MQSNSSTDNAWNTCWRSSRRQGVCSSYRVPVASLRSCSNCYPCTSTEDFYGAPTSALRQQRQLAEAEAATTMQIPLFHKQAIIVLREELEYFAIPSNVAHMSGPLSDITNQHSQPPATDEHGNANPPLMHIKAECGKDLLHRRSIFTALQRNVNRENNVAEQHLIDMLCMRWVHTSMNNYKASYPKIRVADSLSFMSFSLAASTETTSGDIARWNRIAAVSPV